MPKKLIVHDLPPEQAAAILGEPTEDILHFAATPMLKTCTGCFGCWLKTPGRCVLKDNASDVSAMMAACDEYQIISRCFYGSVSPEIKAVFDRNISYVLPFFHIVKDEMHHTQRYNHSFNYSMFFYGEDITDAEKKTAKSFSDANSLNFNVRTNKVSFFSSPLQIKEALT